jgi:1-acyl-sn-glycerol-3-phosphate acyltransferase
MLRNLLRSGIKFLFFVLSDFDVKGLDNIPPEGGVILAVNHLSRLDAPLIFMLLKRGDATALVADTYQENSFFRWIVEAVDGIWINRKQADFQALREAQKYLEGGGLLGVAPEGTRSNNGALMQAKIGMAYLAEKARVPVVPTAIYGTETISHKLSRLKRPKLYVQFGQPVRFPPLKQSGRSKALEKNTDEIMCQIAAMLPEAYRGAYADHPRLQELLQHKEDAPTATQLDTPQTSGIIPNNSIRK